MSEKELKLSGLAKFGLFILVVLTSAVAFYMTSRYTSYVLEQAQLSTINSNTFLIFTLIGGIVGGMLAFVFEWVIGILSLVVIKTKQYKDALYLALVIRYSVINVFTASFLLFSNKILNYGWLTSLLELLIFFGCYYKLTNKALKNSLQVTGVYVVLFLLSQVIAGAF